MSIRIFRPFHLLRSYRRQTVEGATLCKRSAPADHALASVATCLLLTMAALATNASAQTVTDAIDRVQPKIVKVYGAGGFRGMEGHQSGMLISPDGHILSVWSYVLDTDYITVVLNDGRKFEARVVGADPHLEVAVLKIEAGSLPYFELADSADVEAGTRVLALSNVFGVATGNESASVQHGVISVKTQLRARRGVFETTYRGPAYVLDAMTNNPGAAGGALVTRNGQLVAMLGKELRNSLNNTWLNYAVPIGELHESVEDIRAGNFSLEGPPRPPEKPERALSLQMLGIAMVPDVLSRTPPYVDRVHPDSPAARAGMRPDDLIVLVNDRLIQTCKSLREELEYVDYEEQVIVTIFRGQELFEVALQAFVEDE